MSDPFQGLNATTLYELAGGIDEAIKRLTPPTKEVIAQLAASQPSVGQLIDLALLSTNLLKGEVLSRFVKRSVEIMK